MHRRCGMLLAVLTAAAVGSSWPALAQSVTVKVSYDWYGDAVDTGAHLGPVNWTVSGTLNEGGLVHDAYEGRGGRSVDSGSHEEKLGGGRWQVVGPHQLRRETNWPNSWTIVTVTVHGSNCDAQVEARLKPGKTVFLTKRVSGGMRAYRNVRYSVRSCTIG